MVYFSKWKVILVLGVCFLGLAYAAPNFFPRQVTEELPSWLPREQVNLGLDLQGGSHLLLEVDVASVIKERLNSIVDGIRPVLRKERIRYGGLGVHGHSVVVSIKDAEVRDKAREVVADVDPDTETVLGEDGKITVTLTEKAIENRRKSAVDQSIEIIRRRIDETGVREPTIQRQGDDRILVTAARCERSRADEAAARQDGQDDLPTGQHQGPGFRGVGWARAAGFGVAAGGG